MHAFAERLHMCIRAYRAIAISDVLKLTLGGLVGHVGKAVVVDQRWSGAGVVGVDVSGGLVLVDVLGDVCACA